METQITYTKGRTARARMRGPLLLVTMPRHWPRSEQEAAISKFQRWGQKQSSVLAALPVAPPCPSLSLAELTALVAQVNHETVNVAYLAVRIGKARFTRLAQVNIRTRVLTFSCYAIDGMPERALRYLILHELCHLIEPNHSRAFWAQVGRHMPDFRELRKAAQRHFQLASHREANNLPPVSPPLAAPTKSSQAPVSQQLRLF